MIFRGRQQVIIFITAGTMLACFILFRYVPLRGKIEANRLRYSQIQLAISKATLQNGQLPGLKEKLAEMTKTVANYERQIPDKRALGDFLQVITSLMNENNLTEQLIQPGNEIVAKALRCIPVKMQCKGKLEQIYEFYKSLQKLDRLIRIEKVRLYNDSNFSGEVSMQTNAVIYCKPRSSGNKI